MIIKKFTFNSFQENTYIISSQDKCMIIDPGCSNSSEKKILENYISNNQLEPIILVNTHCHLDHIFGNKFVSEKYGLTPKMHVKDLLLLEKSVEIAKLYNVHLDPPPLKVDFINENESIQLGETRWDIIFAPGHAPGPLPQGSAPQSVSHPQTFVQIALHTFTASQPHAPGERTRAAGPLGSRSTTQNRRRSAGSISLTSYSLPWLTAAITRVSGCKRTASPSALLPSSRSRTI